MLVYICIGWVYALFNHGRTRELLQPTNEPANTTNERHEVTL